MGERDTAKPPLKAKMKTHATISDPGQIAAGAPPGLGLELQQHIGRQLKAVYEEVAQQPIPDRFVRLLEELERKQAPKP